MPGKCATAGGSCGGDRCEAGNSSRTGARVYILRAYIAKAERYLFARMGVGVGMLARVLCKRVNCGHSVARRLVAWHRGQILEIENAKATPPAREIPFANPWRDPSDNIYNPARTATRS